MKLPAHPPVFSMPQLLSDEDALARAWGAVNVATDRYLSWEEMSFRQPPEGLSRELWWGVTALKREGVKRELPLRRLTGERFWFTLPDAALQALEDIAKRAAGAIAMEQVVTTGQSRDEYLIRGLMDEAITSSQLEGATTTRRVAKEMLRSQRPPRTKDERMIRNNYEGMQFVRDHRSDTITAGLILELHAILTRETLRDQRDAGRLQTPDEERVHVGTDELVVHEPPLARELPERLEELCTFANGGGVVGWLSPVARAIFVHFMAGHDHYFVDGNGRLARALFYWVMLKNDYWLTEFVTISKILRGAPTKYAHSYLNSEFQGDATYFLLYQLTVLQRSFDELEAYLGRQTKQAANLRAQMRGKDLGLNHRQIAALEGALENPSLDFTMKTHATTHGVTPMTARSDLSKLEDIGLLERRKVGREFHWWPVRDLATVLRGVGKG